MNLSWTPSLPTCIPLICPQPAQVAHGVAEVQGYSYLDTVSYTCNPGYEIRVGVDTVVDVNINKDDFFILISIIKQREDSLCFHGYMYKCCLKAW